MKKLTATFIFLLFFGFSNAVLAGSGPPPPPPPPLGVPIDAGALVLLVIGSVVGVVSLSKRMRHQETESSVKE